MVDLVPQDYRQALRLRRWLRVFGWACAGLAALVGLGRLELAYLMRGVRAELTALSQIEAARGTQRARLADLRARTNDAGQRIRALEILRGPAVIDRLFLAVDAAMTGKVWFNEFSFGREGEIAEGKPQALQTGTFLLMPRKAPADTPRGASAAAAGVQPWHARQRVEIRGQASDHSALADFIHRLGGQPGIAQVRLVDTAARRYSRLEVVDFQLAVALGPRPDAPR